MERKRIKNHKTHGLGNPVVLAFDPSLTAFGYVVVEPGTDRIVDKGCIQTKPSPAKLKARKGDDRCRRVSELNRDLLSLLQKYDVKLIVSEQPHGSQSAVSAVMIGITLGLIQTISDITGVPLEWYSEADSKKALLRKKAASKDEVKDEIDRLYTVEWANVKYRDEAVADAIAVYHVAKQQSEIIRFLKNYHG